MTKRDEFLAIAARVATVALAVGGVLALSALVYVWYHFDWTADRKFGSWVYSMVYYGVPLTLALLQFASLKLTPAQRVNVFVVFASSGASVYGAELFMETRSASLNAVMTPVMSLLQDSNNKKQDAARLARDWGIEIDTRSAGEVIAALQRTGVDAVPIVTPSNHLFIGQPDGSIKSAVTIDGREVMPLAGMSNEVTLLCNENGQWIDYRSDKRGFNNANEIWQSDRLEIAALGDSFAHGYCVPPEKNFVALIRQRHPATLNLGIAGDGPLLMLAKLTEYLPHFKPKIVLWFYYEGNDLTDMQTERKSALLRNYLQDGFTQSGLARQHDIDRAITDEIPRLKALEHENWTRRKNNKVMGKVLDVARLAVLREKLRLVGGMETNDSQMAADLQGPNMEVFRQVLLQAKVQTDGWGGRLEFVYLPEWARYAGHVSWGKARRSEVLTLVRSLGIPIVDIDPAFQAHGDPLSLFPFRAVGHYNEMGHRLVSEEVLKTISQGH